MLFWLGLLIAVLSFLVGLEPAKKWIRSHWTFLSDSHFNSISCVIFAVGCVLAIIGHFKDLNESKGFQNEISSIRSSIRHVKASVQVRLTGDWKNSKGPSGTIIPPGRIKQVVVLLYDTNDIGHVGLDLIGTAKLKTEEDGNITISYESETPLDSPIIGRSIEQFESAHELHVTPIFKVPNAETTDGMMRIVSARICLSVNGIHHYNIIQQPQNPVIGRLNDMLVLSLDPNNLRTYRAEELMRLGGIGVLH